MARNAFRNGASLYRVIENSPVEHLRAFLLQQDNNFRPVHETIEPIFASAQDAEVLRKQLLSDLNALPGDQVEPLDVECHRVLGLTEAKGPTSLQTIIDKRLSHEECLEFEDQPDNLAKSLWAHVHHRREFDDAVSFKAIRSWRNAGRLFAAFNVDLDGKGERFSTEEINTDKLAAAISKKLKTNRPISISLIDLPKVPEYPPSVLAIVRFAGQQASVATHGDGGERRLIYFLPQDEAILIYTPADERIEVAATRAAVRNVVAECFAVETLGQDVSTKPLTSASYETRRFLTTMDLPLPDITGFTVVSAKVVELELRIENWQSRLSLKVGGKTDMGTLVERYLSPGHVLRRALGVSHVLMVIGYEQPGEEQRKVLEIKISDGNSCSLNSERDPVIRNFGRKLLEAWGIMRAFRDLDAAEAVDLLPVMAELWELDQTTQRGGYFTARGITTKPLEDARLIRRKETEPKLTEEEDDPEVEGPADSDRTIYAIDLDWMQERLITALKGIVDGAAQEDVAAGLAFLGVMQIDDRDVPCYLARGIDQMKTFVGLDERLRARSGAGPGIVFTGKSAGPSLIGANVVVSLAATGERAPNIGADRTAMEVAFRAGRSLALGAGTLELVEEGDAAARLHVPGRDPLNLFGEIQLNAFRLLVRAAQRGGPGVKTAELLGGKTGKSLENMMGASRWPVIKTYIEQAGYGYWQLRLH